MGSTNATNSFGLNNFFYNTLESLPSLPIETIWAGASMAVEVVSSVASWSFATNAAINIAIKEFPNFKYYFQVCSAAYSNVRLFRAVSSGDVNQMKQLLEQGFDVDRPIFLGISALNVAAMTGDVEMLKFLINEGANVNAGSKLQIEQEKLVFCPLLQALSHVSKNDEVIEVAKSFIKEGAKLNVKDGCGYTPLHVAILRENPETELVELLIEAGAKLNVKNRFGYTPLELVLDRENPNRELAELLIEKGAPLDNKDPKGSTPLGILMSKETPDIELAKLLIEKGARPDSPTPSVLGPFGELRSKSFPQIEQILSELLKNQEESPQIMTALFQLLENLFRTEKKELFVNFLIKNLANINSVDRHGDTLLHILMKYHDDQNARSVLKNGGKLDVRNEAGETPFDSLRTSYFPRINPLIEFLLEEGHHKTILDQIDVVFRLITEDGVNTTQLVQLVVEEKGVDFQDENGDTLLHILVLKGDREGVQYLIDQGASLGISNEAKQKPSDLDTSDEVRNLLSEVSRHVKRAKR